MTSINQDIPTQSDDQYIAGDDATLTIDIDKDDGTAKDLTNASVRFVVSNRPGGSTQISKDTSGDVTITDAANGQVEVNIDPTDTEDLGGVGGRDYHYEVEATDNAGDDATVTVGTWTIYPDTA